MDLLELLDLLGLWRHRREHARFFGVSRSVQLVRERLLLQAFHEVELVAELLLLRVLLKRAHIEEGRLPLQLLGLTAEGGPLDSLLLSVLRLTLCAGVVFWGAFRLLELTKFLL